MENKRVIFQNYNIDSLVSIFNSAKEFNDLIFHDMPTNTALSISRAYISLSCLLEKILSGDES